MVDQVLTLAYRRVNGTELSTGAFLLSFSDGNVADLERFENLAYIDMMKKFAKHLTENPEAGAVIQRTDRPGLVALRMPDDEVALFRSDPAAAIRQRIIPPQVVHIGVDRAKAVEPALAVVPPLDAGYGALPEYFGDVVFARVRSRDGEHRVECVCCGTWCSTSKIDATRHSYQCIECTTRLPIADYKAEVGWAGFTVKDLLQLSATQFFLPRRWNVHGNWITRAELAEMYNNYVKEKNE